MPTQSGVFLPFVKFDARAGKFQRVDKQMDGQSVSVDIPNGTPFAFDIGTLEAGYVKFVANSGPDRKMKPYVPGMEMPPQPEEKDADGKLLYRPGFWVKLAGNGIGGVREFSSNAAIVVNALDDFYNSIASAPEAAAGQIPLITIASVVSVRSGSGARATNNYAPVFQLMRWVDRPNDLGPRTVPLPHPQQAAGQQQVPVSQMTPQATAAMAAATVAPPAPASSTMPF